ncbi:MAG: hypothetical protein LBC65_02475 [Oscillospiraceae bacterium]|jgi:hypothetical protein|nr:hypothetical protein [Oscillospiraceae bacterium]
MRYILIEVLGVDYSRLVSEVREARADVPAIIAGAIKLVTIGGDLSGFSKQLQNLGVFTKITASRVGIVGRTTNMLNINITIDGVDPIAAIRRVREHGGSGGGVVPRVLEIVEPFAADTLRTIPPSAIAELFNLLAKERLIELAKEFGVSVSEIRVTAP